MMMIDPVGLYDENMDYLNVNSDPLNTCSKESINQSQNISVIRLNEQICTNETSFNPNNVENPFNVNDAGNSSNINNIETSSFDKIDVVTVENNANVLNEVPLESSLKEADDNLEKVEESLPCENKNLNETIPNVTGNCEEENDLISTKTD